MCTSVPLRCAPCLSRPFPVPQGRTMTSPLLVASDGRWAGATSSESAASNMTLQVPLTCRLWSSRPAEEEGKRRATQPQARHPTADSSSSAFQVGSWCQALMWARLAVHCKVDPPMQQPCMHACTRRPAGAAAPQPRRPSSAAAHSVRCCRQRAVPCARRRDPSRSCIGNVCMAGR